MPALIVIHEDWGWNDGVKQAAAKLADQGYVALAIDLYRGKVADNPDLAHELMRGVPEDGALRDLRAAYDFLASQPNVKRDRLGSIGWVHVAETPHSIRRSLSPNWRPPSSTTDILSPTQRN